MVASIASLNNPCTRQSSSPLHGAVSQANGSNAELGAKRSRGIATVALNNVLGQADLSDISGYLNASKDRRTKLKPNAHKAYSSIHAGLPLPCGTNSDVAKDASSLCEQYVTSHLWHLLSAYHSPQKHDKPSLASTRHAIDVLQTDKNDETRLCANLAVYLDVAMTGTQDRHRALRDFVTDVKNIEIIRMLLYFAKTVDRDLGLRLLPLKGNIELADMYLALCLSHAHHVAETLDVLYRQVRNPEPKSDITAQDNQIIFAKYSILHGFASDLKNKTIHQRALKGLNNMASALDVVYRIPEEATARHYSKRATRRAGDSP